MAVLDVTAQVTKVETFALMWLLLRTMMVYFKKGIAKSLGSIYLTKEMLAAKEKPKTILSFI